MTKARFDLPTEISRRNWTRGLRFILALAMALFKAAAQADSLSYTNLFVYNNVPVFSTSNGGTDGHFSGQNVYAVGSSVGPEFSRFNAALGQLDSVDWSITLSGEAQSHFSYYSWFGSPGYGSVGEQLTLLSIRLGSFSTPDKYLSSNGGFPFVSGEFTVPFFGTADGSLSLLTTINSQMTDPALLNALLDETSFYLDSQSRYSYASSYATGSGSLSAFQIELSYTYNFTPAPEPSTVGLIALGAFLWLFRGRRS
jgi:hypothetical protein